MAANEDKLGKLHEKLAEVIASALDGDELPGYTDPESGEVFEGKRLPASAAILTVAAKFLKDNNITCMPSENNKLGELAAKMEERKKRRKVAPMDFSQAEAQADFMRGLPN